MADTIAVYLNRKLLVERYTKTNGKFILSAAVS